MGETPLDVIKAAWPQAPDFAQVALLVHEGDVGDCRGGGVRSGRPSRSGCHAMTGRNRAMHHIGQPGSSGESASAPAC